MFAAMVLFAKGRLCGSPVAHASLICENRLATILSRIVRANFGSALWSQTGKGRTETFRRYLTGLIPSIDVLRRGMRRGNQHCECAIVQIVLEPKKGIRKLPAFERG